MKKLLLLIIAITMAGCAKDEPTIVDGFYAVTFDDNLGTVYQGEILIEGYKITFDAMPYWKRELNANISGTTVIYNNPAPYVAGTATVKDNRISGWIRIQAQGGIKQYGFEGYK
jgi:hypothetical protein